MELTAPSVQEPLLLPVLKAQRFEVQSLSSTHKEFVAPSVHLPLPLLLEPVRIAQRVESHCASSTHADPAAPSVQYPPPLLAGSAHTLSTQ
jgi:hypothetical protein